MNSRLRPLLYLAAGIVASASLVLPAGAEPQKEVVPGEVLVGMRGGFAFQAIAPAFAEVGQPKEYLPRLGVYRLKLRPGLSLERAMAHLRQRPEVLYVEPNGLYHTTAIPNDPSFGSQYAPTKVQADLAWGIWQPQATTVIAVVDTGIDYNHPDLTNKIYRTTSGLVIGKNTYGSNARTNDPADPYDDEGHGTHCSGIAAAQVNNGVGIAGIAGWNGVANSSDSASVKLMPVKVLSSTGSGSDANVASGVTWAADNGARVISLSLGGGGSTTLSNAISYAWSKGCVIVAAAGNSSSSALSYPAAYPNVISVAATTSTDTLASYSNYGSWVTCAAPGSSIYATLPTWSGNYGTMSGTSMATPLVAGEAALLLAHKPTLTNSDVRSLILTNVDPYTPYSGRTIATGAGRVNVYKALLAASGAQPTVPVAPTGLVATAGNALVSLVWNASAGATSYKVKRATTSGGPYTTVATGVATTTYMNTGLTNGTLYYYVVSAVNSAGEGGNSAQASATPQATISSQLLGNPGFESGATLWTATAGVIDSDPAVAPRTGSWKAWLNGYGATSTDTLSQKVTIPATATKATLTFWLWVSSQEGTGAAYDTLKVQVRNSSNAVLKTLATYSNKHKGSSYVQRTFDLLAYKGQTITIYCEGKEDASVPTSFLMDDFALTVQ